MTSQTTPIQRTFDFDLSTLNNCIATLKPKRLQTVFRGLLLAAAAEPYLVTDIDSDGYIIMEASMTTVARRAEISVRGMQVALQSLDETHPKLVEKSFEVNSVSRWLFNLRSALPESSIEWFVHLVENSKSAPRTNEKCAPNFSKVRPEQKQKCAPKCAPNFSNLSSMCFLLDLTSLAELREICRTHGVAFHDGDGTWKELVIDHEGLHKPAVVDAIAALAMASGTYPDEPATRNRFFVLAAIGQRKSWWYVRDCIVKGWLFSSRDGKQDREIANRMRQQADELRRRKSELHDAAKRAAQPARVESLPEITPSTPVAVASTTQVCSMEKVFANMQNSDFGRRWLQQRAAREARNRKE